MGLFGITKSDTFSLMNFLILVGISVTIVLGLFSVLLLAHRIKKNDNEILRSLLSVVIYLNSIWFLGLMLEFFKSKFFIINNTHVVFGLEIFLTSCLFILRFIFLVAFFRLFESILNLTIVNQFQSALKKTALIIMVVWILGWMEIPLNGSREIVDNLMIYTDILIFGSVIFLSIYLFSRSKLIIDFQSKKAIRFLCIVIILPFILACLKWVIGGSLDNINESLERILLHSFVFLTNLLMIWWTFTFGSDLLKRIGFTARNVKVDLNEVAGRYGISKREMEIISLIREGKTNQEIADELFLSIETIKDHNHNIFQKTGVKNRTQLANLFNQK